MSTHKYVQPLKNSEEEVRLGLVLRPRDYCMNRLKCKILQCRNTLLEASPPQPQIVVAMLAALANFTRRTTQRETRFSFHQFLASQVISHLSPILSTTKLPGCSTLDAGSRMFLGSDLRSRFESLCKSNISDGLSMEEMGRTVKVNGRSGLETNIDISRGYPNKSYPMTSAGKYVGWIVRSTVYS